MRVLFDQGAPVPLRKMLHGHSVSTAYELGWNCLGNGELIAKAESAGFDVLVTTDKNLKYQQNLAERRIAILVLPTTSWPALRERSESIAKAVTALGPGAYFEFAL
jgi:hypothetical protein